MDTKKYKNGSEFPVVDKETGESVPPNSGGVFQNHEDGSQTRLAAPTGDPPCKCEETSLAAKVAADTALGAPKAVDSKVISGPTIKTPGSI